MNRSLQGVLPILQTPFRTDDTLDSESLQREIDWCFELGVSGVCSAMVSEVLRLTTAERFELTELMVSQTAGRGAVIASVSAESIAQALEYARQAERTGVTALMAIPPLGAALPEPALWEYFSRLARAVDVPLIVQDASSYVGKAIPVTFYIQLLQEFGPEKILFKPEAAPLGPNVSLLRDLSQGEARIFDGSGGLLLVDCYRRGIAGTMPGVDLLDGTVALWQALQAGDEETVYALHFPICAIAALQMQAGLDGFLAIEKYLLVQRGIFRNDQRRPPYSWSLDDETQAEVDRLFLRMQNALAATVTGK